ncbi:8-amino-7-oxononanoate synthase [Pseudonocardia sp. RS11V-5]|uniref:8-amino-7-oxononanoate synthase n=1 Tax=Pseudonocardia terrae TaxID=2905831 RepID=UPI001E3D77C6|nr:8-amino-7-oxononanoate synthase [Pseudonocardia terrae]MCE3554546.1 8-amino-7-oxononanoate synthase [Pseudonocardia terrae]
MAHPLDWLESNAERRRSEGLRRSLRPRTSNTDGIDLAGNDYLGLARDKRVVDGAVQALRTWGVGSTGSRLVTGSTALHATLEEELAAFCGAEAALVFSSGYTANLGVVTALSGRGALVVSDAHSHASLVDACRLSRSRVVVTPRADVAAVDAALAARTEARALVVTDGVDSIDGGVAPLRELHAVCRARSAVLVVDEAHALGVCGPGGRGVLSAAGLAGAGDVVATVTLSKSLGGQGGAVLGPRAVIEHLVDTARTFIFDTGLAPACVGGALAALRVLCEEPDRPAAVLRVAQELAAIARAGLAAQVHSAQEQMPLEGPSSVTGSAVVPVVLGSPVVAFEAAGSCLARGVRVGCFRPPSVPEGTSRLRLTARADLTTAELDRVRVVLHEVLAEITEVRP